MPPSINNYLRISPHLTTSGQPTVEQFGLLHEDGVSTVINLLTPDSKGAIPDEGDIITRLGMSYVHIPVIWDTPTRDDFDLFAGVLFANRDRHVHVHCVVNMRVSAFVFLYRTVHAQEDPVAAKEDLEKIWTPNPIWQEYIDEILDANGLDYATI